jgi:hypothetical protein
MATKKKTMVAYLPVTPCTMDMKDRMLKIASDKGISLAELQREAFRVFLTKSDTKSITIDSLVSN